MRTVNRLGIQTVAVYNNANRDAFHVKSTNEAVLISPPSAWLSYLKASPIVKATIHTSLQVREKLVSCLVSEKVRENERKLIFVFMLLIDVEVNSSKIS